MNDARDAARPHAPGAVLFRRGEHSDRIGRGNPLFFARGAEWQPDERRLST
jgi:hypothetical protein